MKTGGAAPLRLKKRKEFLAAARGERRHAASFTLQVLARKTLAQEIRAQEARPGADLSAGDSPGSARFGLTVTKKTFPLSVHRNRVRRRFREALRLGAALSAAAGHDYVFIARESAVSAPFEQLKSEISAALSAPPRARRPKSRPTPS